MSHTGLRLGDRSRILTHRRDRHALRGRTLGRVRELTVIVSVTGAALHRAKKATGVLASEDASGRVSI